MLPLGAGEIAMARSPVRVWRPPDHSSGGPRPQQAIGRGQEGAGSFFQRIDWPPRKRCAQ